MNNEENQGFTSFDFITMMVSFAVIAAVTAPIIKKNIQSDKSLERARFETKSLGQSLLNPRNLQDLSASNTVGVKSGRSLASISKDDEPARIDLESLKTHLKKGEWEGDIGKDPWGNPYHFTFLKNDKGMATHVAVWSDGPNKKNDTKSRTPTSVELNGDDLGSVIPLR